VTPVRIHATLEVIEIKFFRHLLVRLSHIQRALMAAVITVNFYAAMICCRAIANSIYHRW
jgi:hypothetical protein